MILVVGDVMNDVIVNPAAPLALGTDTSARIVMRGGGSGANVACWIGHLGGNVKFAGRVGRDDAARQAARLRAHGAQPWLGIDDDLPTGSVVAIISQDGERSFYTDRGANLRLCAQDLPESLLDGVRLLHVSGHTLFTPGPCEAARALMRNARARGCSVSVDAASISYLAEVGAEAFAAWTTDAELCFANAAEAALLLRRDMRFAMLIVTEGADGATAHAGNLRTHVAAASVAPLDTTGAGDAFVAGVLCARMNGAAPPDFLESGNAAAARAIAIFGGRPPNSS